MSRTIHYIGRLQNESLLSELQEEFAEIAQVSGWTHERIHQTYSPGSEGSKAPRTLRGIQMVVSKSAGPIRFTFDADGYLAHYYYETESHPAVSGRTTEGSVAPSTLPVPSRPYRYGRSQPRAYGRDVSSDENRILHQVHANTLIRDGGADAHRTVVKLLDYLRKKYVPNLEVIDPTGYWMTRDDSILEFRALELVPQSGHKQITKP
jgi:hypothetical protein